MNLLLLSNSTNPGEDYLGWPRKLLADFIQQHQIQSALFIPYAGVTITWNDYESRVKAVFEPFGCKIASIHHEPDPKAAVRNSECIIVGGGNTFNLFEVANRQQIMDEMRLKVLAGAPFIGWSAGANIACPTLRTTNDMPIIMPASFNGLHLVPFQINPHYLDANPEGHGGETREQRILEFLEINRDVTVVGLREATALKLHNGQLTLHGEKTMRVFRYAKDPVELKSGDDLSFLLK